MKLKTMYNRYKRNKDVVDFLDDAQIFEEDNYTVKYYDELNQEEPNVYLCFDTLQEDDLILFSISVFDNDEEPYFFVFNDVYFACAKYLELLNKFDNAYKIAEKKYLLSWDFVLDRKPLFDGFVNQC